MNSHSVPLHVLVRVTNGEKESTVAAMHRIEDRSFHDSAQLIKLNATQRNSTQLNSTQTQLNSTQLNSTQLNCACNSYDADEMSGQQVSGRQLMAYNHHGHTTEESVENILFDGKQGKREITRVERSGGRRDRHGQRSRRLRTARHARCEVAERAASVRIRGGSAHWFTSHDWHRLQRVRLMVRLSAL